MRKITIGIVAILMAIGTVVFAGANTQTKKANACCTGSACCKPGASCCVSK